MYAAEIGEEFPTLMETLMLFHLKDPWPKLLIKKLGSQPRLMAPTLPKILPLVSDAPQHKPREKLDSGKYPRP